jgi:hypothetical protein
MQIRDAVQEDFGQITAIYNEVLTHSTAIYSDQPATVEERISWWRSRIAQRFPVLVSTDGAGIAGFATFGDFRVYWLSIWLRRRFASTPIPAARRRPDLLKAILAHALSWETRDDRGRRLEAGRCGF